MVNKEVCMKCWKELSAGEELPEVVEKIGFIDPEDTEWECCLAEEDTGIEDGVGVVGADDPTPPEDCPKLFEHAVAAGMKHAK